METMHCIVTTVTRVLNFCPRDVTLQPLCINVKDRC